MNGKWNQTKNKPTEKYQTFLALNLWGEKTALNYVTGLSRHNDSTRQTKARNTEMDRRLGTEWQTLLFESVAIIKHELFEEPSNKKRFYPDVYCWGHSRGLLITISTEGNIQDHNVLLNRHNYINMGTSQNSPAFTSTWKTHRLQPQTTI